MKLLQRVLSIPIALCVFVSFYILRQSINFIQIGRETFCNNFNRGYRFVSGPGSYEIQRTRIFRDYNITNISKPYPTAVTNSKIMPHVETNFSTFFNTSRRTPEIGVYGTIGKWYGQFKCGPGPRDNVSVIQTTNYERLSKSDVLFLQHNSNFNWESLRRIRSPGQIWIYKTFENPKNSRLGARDAFAKDVNWTFTYKSDATFPSPYGAYYPRDVPDTIMGDSVNWAQNKTGTVPVCALVSNCISRRMKVIMEIASFIGTDIYGRCGNKACSRNKSCHEMLSKYKFILAFENTQCADYITEKFWYNALSFGIVPVVLGARPEDYRRVAPPHSYIHVKDFSSIKKLTDYLHILDRNDDLYNFYFEWKRQYYVKGNLLADHHEPDIVMCRILKKLNEVKSYKLGTVDVCRPDLVKSWLDSCSK